MIISKALVRIKVVRLIINNKLYMIRKALMAVGAVAAFGGSILLMGNGYNDELLAITGILGATAMALIIGQWVVQK